MPKDPGLPPVSNIVNNPASDAQSNSESVVTASPTREPKDSNDAKVESTTAKELHWLEKLNFAGQFCLVIVGIVAASIYGCQLRVMRGQLNQMEGSSKQTDDLLHLYQEQVAQLRKEADASIKSAITAKDTLTTQQMNFEIDQRPYLVAENFQFIEAPKVDQPIKANVTFRNIGRTPATRYVAAVQLLRFDALPIGDPKATSNFVSFIEPAFAKLKQTNASSIATLKKFHAEQDIAPNDTQFTTSGDNLILGSADFPKLNNGTVAIYYLGILSYTDSFNRTYETQFCRIYFGSDPKTWHICDSHNTIK